MKPITTLIIFLQLSLPVFCQTDSNADTLTPAEQKQVVDSISNLLNRNYIFPDVAQKMSDLISLNIKNGKYRSIIHPALFADRLTADLRSVSRDKHINVGFNPGLVKILKNQTQDSQIPVSFAESLKLNNYGFKEIKFLPGNIGYLDLRMFADTSLAGETAVAAMNFLSNANALIIDLRKNGGGSPGMIQLITSYLYGPEKVHLNTFYYRPANSYSETWTLNNVKGKRRPDVDVYVLTSHLTFSAAEEFSYNLKNLRRATIVGEVTGGGAHPGGEMPATDRFIIWVPTGRAINPITKTNWEGTGVQPDIEVPEAAALLTAHAKALEKLVQKNPENNIYKWLEASAKAKLRPKRIEEAVAKQYTGVFGPIIVTYQDGNLYMQPQDFPAKSKLVLLEKDLFDIDMEDNPMRLQFVMEKGKAAGLTILFPDGRSEKFMRN